MTDSTLGRSRKLLALTCVGTACASFLTRTARSATTAVGVAATVGVLSLSAGQSAQAGIFGDIAKGIDQVSTIAKSMDRGSKGFQQVLSSANSDSLSEALSNGSRGLKKMDRSNRRAVRAAQRLGIGG